MLRTMLRTCHLQTILYSLFFITRKVWVTICCFFTILRHGGTEYRNKNAQIPEYQSTFCRVLYR